MTISRPARPRKGALPASSPPITDIAEPQSRIRARLPLPWEGLRLSISRRSREGSAGLAFTR
jgi:hypothetical protein